MSAASLALRAAVRVPGHPKKELLRPFQKEPLMAATGGSEMGGPGFLGP